jgi:hypothetical protein
MSQSNDIIKEDKIGHVIVFTDGSERYCEFEAGVKRADALTNAEIIFGFQQGSGLIKKGNNRIHTDDFLDAGKYEYVPGIPLSSGGMCDV